MVKAWLEYGYSFEEITNVKFIALYNDVLLVLKMVDFFQWSLNLIFKNSISCKLFHSIKF